VPDRARSIRVDGFRIDVVIRSDVDVPVAAATLARTAAHALGVAGAPAGSVLALTFSNDAELATLNAEHMGHRGPTDVLSFPLLPPSAFPSHPGKAPAGTDGPRFVLPPGRRPHVGDVVVSIERAREQAAEGAVGDRPRWLTSFLWDGDVGGRVLLTGAGYEPFRRFASMRRADLDAIEPHRVPDGLEIRPVPRDAVEMRRVFDADVEAFRDHFGWVDASSTAFEELVTDPELDPSLWVVAFDGGEIAGGVLNGIHTGQDGARQGWLDSVFTRRPWRRRGLARALIARSLRLLRDRGLDRAYLGVDATNPNQALTLYESAGFEVVSSATAYRKRLDAPVRS